MPDTERLNQIQMLAKVIGSLPGPKGMRAVLAPPIRIAWATEMYDHFGVSVDLARAKKEIAVDGPSHLGAHAPQYTVDIAPVDPVKLMRDTGRQLGITELEELADEIAAATTAEAKQALIAKMSREYPDLMRHAEQAIAKAKPEDFEPEGM